jgi:hypothetical protein
MSESQAPLAVVLIIILLLVVGAIVAFVFIGNQNAGTTPTYNTGSNYPTTTTPTVPNTPTPTPSTGTGGTPGASCTTTSGFAGTYDCRGACLEKGYMDMSLSNGYCDDMGASGLNLNCGAFNYDNGECNSAPTTPTTPTIPTGSWCTAGDTYKDGSFQGSTDGFYTFEGYNLCRATLSDETGTAYFYTNEDGSIWYLTDEYGTIALSHLDGTGGGTGTPSGTAIPVTVTGSYTIREWCPAAVGKIFKDLRKMPNSNIMFAYEYTTSGLIEWDGRLWCEHLANDPSNEAYYVYQNEAGVVELRQDSEGNFLDIEGAHKDYMLTLTVKSAPGATLAEDITFYTFVGEDVEYSYTQSGIEYCGAGSPCLIQLSSISATRPIIEFTRDDYASQQISPSIGQCENAYPLSFCTDEIVQRV